MAVTTARKALAAFSAAGGHWRCAKSTAAAASLTLAGATVHSRSASAAPRSPPAVAVAMYSASCDSGSMSNLAATRRM